MNESRAHILSDTLIGTTFEGWVIEERKGLGKSAIVFKVRRPDRVAALKIFDPELVDLYGRDIQEERIRRQLSLVGSVHPNLVGIFDGGWSDTRRLFYLVMEYLDMPTVDTCLAAIPADRIGALIAQVASAARTLEDRGLAHRDIKPANIATSRDFARAILLDLGVIRPIGTPGGTDSSSADRFVGTMRYSPPEFMLRQETDTVEGWRAVTFYQIGAVLCDMLTRKPLFIDRAAPVARLVDAVRNEAPSILVPDAPRRLIQLARNCLVKDPYQRLALVRWEDFAEAAMLKDEFSIDEVEQRLRARRARSIITRESTAEREQEQQLRSARRTLAEAVVTVESAISRYCIASDDFPPVEVHLTATGPHSSRLLVIFCRSTEHELPAYVHLWLDAQLVDAGSRVVEILAVAGVLEHLLHDRPADAPKPAAIFKGVFDASSVDAALRDVSLRTLDAAQQATSGGGSCVHPLWLDVRGAADVRGLG